MTDWYQQALTPPEVLELNIRLGLIPSQDHGQAMVELQDRVPRILIAQWSAPHFPLRDVSTQLDACVARARNWFDQFVEPF